MKMARCAPLILVLMVAFPAQANVPVNDAAVLERKAQESTHKVELKSVLLDHKKKREGIKCAVTKSGRGNVQNPERQANPATGSGAVESYAPGLPTTPQQGVTGGTLNEQHLGSEASKVVSGVEATQGTIAQTGEAYRARSIEVGSTQTVTEALDQNSSIRLQNGMTWNQVIASTNLLVQALNALSLANQSDASQAATTLVGPTDPRPPTPPGRTCPTGYSGVGSTSDPCRPSVCSTTPSGTAPDQACITRRYVDSDGNVRVYLELASTLVIEQSRAAANRPATTNSITPAELIDALAASQRRAGATN